MQGAHEDLLLLLLREGSRSQAIQLYREETGANSQDARDAVLSLAMRHGVRQPRLTLLPLLALLVAFLVVVIGGVVAAMAG